MYRVGIIGCGRIGCEFPDSHLQAYLDCPDTELVAICDTDANKLWAYPIKWKHYNYQEMVEVHKLDIVSICTPPETHCKIVCEIAPYVKAIYCEKPIALTLEDADKMIDICDKYKVILQINHQRRFTQPKFHFSRGILNTGTHAFDLVRQLFRDDVQVEMEYIDTDESIFELDCTHNKEPMILKGVEHLVKCLKEGRESISSGREARKTLELVLKYRELHEI